MKRARQLSDEARISLVDKLQEILYLDHDPSSETFRLVADKEWSPDTLEAIGALMAEHDLVPEDDRSR